GGVEQPPIAPPDASSLAGSFLQHGFMAKSILEGVQRPKDLAAWVPVTTPRLLRMLRYSQARSSSMDLHLFGIAAFAQADCNDVWGAEWAES
ncbi:MAG: hypothetical protein FWF18_05430, partial [Dehalococcoidia bacterium]|nr:hypothetical protein [Dehalococcoidia bacterium]